MGHLGENVFTHDLGVSQARIAPSKFTPLDGSFVYCFGSDRVPGPVVDVIAGQPVTLRAAIGPPNQLITFGVGFRQPAGMPAKRTLPAGTTLQRGNVVVAGDGLSAIVTLASFFTGLDLKRVVRISGAVNPANNGDFTIVSIKSATAAILAQNVVAEAAGFAALMPGYLWEARFGFGDSTDDAAFENRYQLRLPRGEDRVKRDVALMYMLPSPLPPEEPNVNVKIRWVLVEEV